MQRKKIDVDVTKDILLLVLEARPADVFVKSILHQYEERGGLSKKQLEGLYGKASKIETIPPSKLATLEAIIKNKPTKERTAATKNTEPFFVKDETVGNAIMKILEKYPEHKRVLFFKAKYDNDETLQTGEITELKRFEKMLK